jgi:hypothetical protein
MREGTKLDAQGRHVFSLDENKHDPFAVVDRLLAAAGAVSDPKADARFERIMQARRYQCKGGISCDDLARCSRQRSCHYPPVKRR